MMPVMDGWQFRHEQIKRVAWRISGHRCLGR
jgi:hypothetical protein